jgi:uncharacterized short protein YbdD (DUF466 family)
MNSVVIARVSAQEEKRSSVVARVRAQLRRLFGMPDYARYLEHQARRHPDATPLSEREFVRTELERKYAGGGGRCC